MSTPDPLAVRGYWSEVARHRKNADRTAKLVAELANAVRANTDPVTSMGDVRRLAAEVADLTVSLSALRALRDVEFLTDPTPA